VTLYKKKCNLKTPFRIKFCKEVKEPSNEVILEKFKQSFNNSYCDHIEFVNGNKLIVRNEIFRIKPDLNWNIWSGIGYAEVTIIENLEKNRKKIEYIIDITRNIRSAIIFLCFALLIMHSNLQSDDRMATFKVILFLLIPLIIIVNLILISRHKYMFMQTININGENIGSYNWKEILEKKTNHELIEIISGNTQLPKEIIELANQELEKRKIETK